MRLSNARMSFLSTELGTRGANNKVELGASGTCKITLRDQSNTAPDTSSLAPDVRAKTRDLSRNQTLSTTVSLSSIECSAGGTSKTNTNSFTSRIWKTYWELSTTLVQTHPIWRRRRQQNPPINIEYKYHKFSESLGDAITNNKVETLNPKPGFLSALSGVLYIIYIYIMYTCVWI